jgi:long-chain acyl-CoA synthetase
MAIARSFAGTTAAREIRQRSRDPAPEAHRLEILDSRALTLYNQTTDPFIVRAGLATSGELSTMSLNVAVTLVESARRVPNHAAVLNAGRAISYAELDADVNRFANVLAELGVRRGHKVVLMLPNVPEFVVCYYGILKLGAVVVPANVMYKAREIEFLMTDSESVACVTCEEYLPEAREAFRLVKTCRNLLVVPFPRPAAEVSDPGIHRYEERMRSADAAFDLAPTDADETAIIVYTSGTTGKPKGAELTHFGQFFQCRVLPAITPDLVRDNDVALVSLPLFHAFGQTVVMGIAVANGTTISLMPRYEPGAALEQMVRDKVTLFAGVPTMYVQMLHHPDRGKHDLSRLRRCMSGGAPIALETLQAWKREFGFDIAEGYGLTESNPIATTSIGEVKPKYGACGKTIWGCDIRIVDDQGNPLPPGKDGEVVIRGPNIMKGYYRNPEATAAALKNGWLYTGDIGRLDEEGYLYIVGRKKEMIIRGGYNVYPREIEELLYEHPAVQECAVIGMPHPELGEEVKAVVYLKAGQQATPEQIRAYCRERMAAFKYPRVVEIRPEPLPKTSTGKILKRALADQSA